MLIMPRARFAAAHQSPHTSDEEAPNNVDDQGKDGPVEEKTIRFQSRVIA